MDSKTGCGNKCACKKEGLVETIHIEKTANICPMCEDYAKKEASKPIAVICCEGACLRGEIARRAANILCDSLAPEKTARICLGGAFTKDTGQRRLVRNAKKVIALEGCFIECSSRMMNAAIPGIKPKIIIADELYEFNRNLFGIKDMPEKEIDKNARKVANEVANML